MARQFIVLCEKDLKNVLTDDKVSAPEADPKPVIAGHVLGTYASAAIAERAIMNFPCSSKHWIVETMKFVPLKL